MIKNFTFLKKIETDDISSRKQISHGSGSPPVTVRRSRAPWYSADVTKQCPDMFQLLFCCCLTGNKVFLSDTVRKSQNHVQPSRFGVHLCLFQMAEAYSVKTPMGSTPSLPTESSRSVGSPFRDRAFLRSVSIRRGENGLC